MKCADCKFWAEKKDHASSFEVEDGVGECRRNAPIPRSETEWLLALILKENGALALSEDAPRPDYTALTWPEMMAAWPTTHGFHFCGEFVSRQERQGFV